MSFGHYLHSLKKSHAAAMPHQKSRFVMHPLNAPETMPVRGGQLVFPEHMHEYKFVGPTAEMVPKEITPGIDRRMAVVGQFERTAQVGEVTVQEHMTASVKDLHAHHAKLLQDGKVAEARKIAVLAHQAVNGIPADPAQGIKEVPGLVSFYKKSIAPGHQEALVVKGNSLVDEDGRFKSLGQEQEQMADAKMGHAHSAIQGVKVAAGADHGHALHLKLNGLG